MMKLLHVLIVSLLLLLLIGPVSAASVNYTSTFNSTDIVRINQSLAQDPTGGKAVPWDLWEPSGFLGIGLVILALIKPRLYRMDYEINIVVSILAWPFLWYFTWGALTSIDRIVGVGMTSVGGTAMMITQHILYTYPVLGGIGVGGDVAAIFVTVLLIGQFTLFKENEEKAKTQNQNQ
jgi:hypothetical protein